MWARVSAAAIEACGPPITVRTPGRALRAIRTSLKLWNRFSVVEVTPTMSGPLRADHVADAAPVESEDVGRDDADVDPFLLEDGPDIEEAEGGHGRALGPALGEIAAGRDEEKDLHALRLELFLSLELHRVELGDVRLLHGRAVDVVGDLHGLVVVGDDDELGLVLDGLHQVEEPAEVDLVEGRVHFVQEAERRRPVAEQGEHEGHRGQRFLAAREQGQVLDALAGRLGDDLDAALERVVRLEELDLGVAALEDQGEDIAEVRVDLFEGLEELGLALLVDLADGLARRVDGIAEVLPLLDEEIEALLLLDELLLGHEVDGLEAEEVRRGTPRAPSRPPRRRARRPAGASAERGGASPSRRGRGLASGRGFRLRRLPRRGDCGFLGAAFLILGKDLFLELGGFLGAPRRGRGRGLGPELGQRLLEILPAGLFEVDEVAVDLGLADLGLDAGVLGGFFLLAGGLEPGFELVLAPADLAGATIPSPRAPSRRRRSRPRAALVFAESSRTYPPIFSRPDSSVPDLLLEGGDLGLGGLLPAGQALDLLTLRPFIFSARSSQSALSPK